MAVEIPVLKQRHFYQITLRKFLSWNFQTQLRAFETILTNEKYFDQLVLLLKNDYSANALATLKSEIKSLEQKMILKAKELHDFFSNFNDKDLPGGSNVTKAFDKLIWIFYNIL